MARLYCTLEDFNKAEFFKLVETANRETVPAQLTGPYALLFRPLIEYQFRTESAAEIEFDGVDDLINNHVEARDSGAYDDFETAHGGGTHIESGKWQFETYVQDIVKTIPRIASQRCVAFISTSTASTLSSSASPDAMSLKKEHSRLNSGNSNARNA